MLQTMSAIPAISSFLFWNEYPTKPAPRIAENEFIEELKKGMVLVSEIKNNPTIH